ncbi:hypothetical protein L2E82_36299 [Cichorium intybus]|uniref:Uncharacterized protein n=1 Tax=Cichorium intybus TaxID=13427 RepID=A0ACB9BRA5_CICIN|nr:hypothetical protein L2E82_36299 [Cichorium intybus]
MWPQLSFDQCITGDSTSYVLYSRYDKSTSVPLSKQQEGWDLVYGIGALAVNLGRNRKWYDKCTCCGIKTVAADSSNVRFLSKV